MWLLNCYSFNLMYHHTPPVNAYATLSHTWGRGEVSFQDIQDLEKAKKMKGFAKIASTCEKALEHGLFYAWVDTCCIDKTSSAELSEAINSMFNWYGNSKVCFVFLEDFAPRVAAAAAAAAAAGGVQDDEEEALPKCRWFSRGWTLQELIAPHHVHFFDSGWNFYGEKKNLVHLLHRITRVDCNVLWDPCYLRHISVAKRMSWASDRKTTRPEDLAYCLMGIFDVNMPLLYGEGDKSFIRLQEAILQRSSDLSLFAWGEEDPRFGGYDLFASSPKDFSQCSTVERICDKAVPEPLIVIGNIGIQVTTSLASWDPGSNEAANSSSSPIRFLHLGCYRGADPDEILVLPLRQHPIGYMHAKENNVKVVNQSQLRFLEPAQLSIRKELFEEFVSISFWIEPDFSGTESLGRRSIRCYPPYLWQRSRLRLYQESSTRASSLVLIKMHFQDADLECWLLCGAARPVKGMDPSFHLVPAHGPDSIPALSELTDEELRSPGNISSLRTKLKALNIYNPESPPSPEPSSTTCTVTNRHGREYIFGAIPEVVGDPSLRSRWKVVVTVS